MDDEVAIQKVLGEMLEVLGFSVTIVNNGKEAIDKYQKSLEIDNQFDLVILDLTIAGGMGGKDTIEKVIPIKLSQIQSNYFDFNINAYDDILVSYKNYIRDSIKETDINTTAKKNIIELILVSDNNNETVFIQEGEFVLKDSVKIAYNMGSLPDAINIINDENNIEVSAPYDMLLTVSVSGIRTIKADLVSIIEVDNVYNTQRGLMFQFKQLHKNISKKELEGEE